MLLYHITAMTHVIEASHHYINMAFLQLIIEQKIEHTTERATVIGPIRHNIMWCRFCFYFIITFLFAHNYRTSFTALLRYPIISLFF